MRQALALEKPERGNADVETHSPLGSVWADEHAVALRILALWILAEHDPASER